jgi:RNA polymerase sigma factor (TIGR02999 family)
MQELTQLLQRARAGDGGAAGKLYDLVYSDLRQIAQRHLRGSRDANAPQTTSLVHEVYLRLARPDGNDFQDRAHFFAVASRAMRQILIDHARKRLAGKRGGGEIAIDLGGIDVAAEDRSDELLAVDEALKQLEQIDPRLAQVVEWRFFGGLTEQEIGDALNLSERTVKRDWRKARAFLQVELERAGGIVVPGGE